VASRFNAATWQAPTLTIAGQALLLNVLAADLDQAARFVVLIAGLFTIAAAVWALWRLRARERLYSVAIAVRLRDLGLDDTRPTQVQEWLREHTPTTRASCSGPQGAGTGHGSSRWGRSAWPTCSCTPAPERHSVGRETVTERAATMALVVVVDRPSLLAAPPLQTPGGAALAEHDRGPRTIDSAGERSGRSRSHTPC
jgi:hypothetical protein